MGEGTASPLQRDLAVIPGPPPVAGSLLADAPDRHHTDSKLSKHVAGSVWRGFCADLLIATKRISDDCAGFGTVNVKQAL
jgi:hypothetical protein